MKFLRNSDYGRLLIMAALAVCIGAVCLAAATWADKDGQAGWVAGDFHQHTTYTDGSNSMKTVMYKNNQFGLDWWANSEHGGSRADDARGPLTIDGPFNVNGGYKWTDTTRYPVNPIIPVTVPARTAMWRWQSIRDYSFWDVVQTRALLSGKVIIQGLEWNVPGHEHCSTGIIANQWDSGNPNANPMAQFEYLFDASDTDTVGGAAQGWTGKNTTNDHAKAIAAVAWMQANYPTTSWIPAHVERKQPPTLGGAGYDIKDFRDLNNAARMSVSVSRACPAIRRNPTAADTARALSAAAPTAAAASTRRKSADSGMRCSAKGGTGGCLPVRISTARTPTSGPANTRRPIPTWLISDNPQAIVDGLRSGNSFVVEGDLINGLDFQATSDGWFPL